MRLTVASGDITSFKAGAIVVNLFEGVSAPDGATGSVDDAMGGAITQLIKSGDIRGKFGEFTLVHSMGDTAGSGRGKMAAARVIVAGLGKQEDLSYGMIRNLSGDLARFLRRQRIKDAAVVAHG